MKNLYKYISLSVLAAASGMTSCKNGEQDFPDYAGGTSVYFAYQYPVRTLVMGEDIYNTDLDNEHKCEIYSVSGGTYDGISATADFKVDESLCDNLYFDVAATEPVKAMPQNYYNLTANSFSYSKSQNAKIGVEFTDAFFADPDAVKNTYVIPLLMTNVTGADKILEGESATSEKGALTDASMWILQPQNFVLYCVKYISKYHAKYLRRGVDKVTYNGATTTEVRHKGVEKDEIVSTSTVSLNTVKLPVSTLLADGTKVTCDLVLTFDANQNCTITSGTDGITASGSGKYGDKTEIKSWGGKDRDALYFNYDIDFGERQISTADTLVLQTRGITAETFAPVYKK